jgi:D-tyrosyl-tRNA(Tyr) deacylase
MRIVIQRVRQASVTVEAETLGEIGPGILALVGFGAGDDASLPESPVWRKMVDKLGSLRIFPDDEGRMNRGLVEADGGLLLVSQFTIYADCKKGRRPSFGHAAEPKLAETLFDRFVQDTDRAYPGRVRTGRFQATMDVALVNWGPVTIILDSDAL